MIEKYVGYKAVCDICGEDFSTSDCAFTVYNTKQELKDELDVNDWKTEKLCNGDDGKVACESCIMEGKQKL